jgi:hypothetical protein
MGLLGKTKTHLLSSDLGRTVSDAESPFEGGVLSCPNQDRKGYGVASLVRAHSECPKSLSSIHMGTA